MNEAWLQYLLSFLVSLGVSTAVAIAIVGGLWRRCTRLEWAIGDLQQRASTFKGREMADKRWKKNEAFEAEMAEALKSAPAPRRKYDNDPLGD